MAFIEGKFTNYTRKAILDLVWGGVGWATLPNLYVTFSTQSSSGYTVGTEANLTQRLVVPNNLTTWPSATNGDKQLGIELLLPTALADLGVAHDIVFYDTPTPGTGNALAYAVLPTTKVVQAGDALLIPAGTITFNLKASQLFTNYLKNAILDHLFGGITFMPAGTWSVGYTTDTPTDTVSGTEPVTGGYARTDIPNNTVYFPLVTSGGNKTNAQQIEWNEATAPQGTATHLIWYNGANYAAKHPITHASIDANNKPYIAANSLAFNLV